MARQRGQDPSSTVANRLDRARGVVTQADIEQQRRDVERIAAVGDIPQTLEGPVDITGDLTVYGVVSTDDLSDGNVTFNAANLRIKHDGNDSLVVGLTDGTKIFQINDSSGLISGLNGADIVLFSDNGITTTLRIDGATGTIHANGADERWEAGFHANYGTNTYTTTGMAAVATSGTLTGFNNVTGGPGVTHTTGIVSGNIAQAVSAVSWRPDWGIDAAFRIRSGNDLTNVRHWVGLFASDPSASGAPAVEYAGFRFDDSADTNWMVRTCDGVAINVTITNSGIPPAINTTQTLRIKTTAGSPYEFYIDGTLVATHSTNLPLTTTQLFAYVSVTTRAAEANAIRVHHVKVLSR